MNGQLTEDQKKRPLRNWSTKGLQFYGRDGRVRVTQAVTPSQSLEIAEIAARIKYGRY